MIINCWKLNAPPKVIKKASKLIKFFKINLKFYQILKIKPTIMAAY